MRKTEIIIPFILLTTLLFLGAECQDNTGPKPNLTPKPGLASQPNIQCGIENCHGLDIKCGPNIPAVCTEVYQLGDSCRKHARCEIVNNKCELVKNEEFEKCGACVKKCEKDFKNDLQAAFECENICRSNFDM